MKMTTTVKATKPTQAYDAEKYKAPWVAPLSVDLWNKRHDGYDFFRKGSFAGKKGQAGRLVIEVEPGTSVGYGRSPQENADAKSETFCAIVQPDGSFKDVSKEEAVANAITRRQAGTVSAGEKCKASAAVAAVIKNFHLKPEDYSPEGVAAQKKALSDEAQARKGANQDSNPEDSGEASPGI